VQYAVFVFAVAAKEPTVHVGRHVARLPKDFRHARLRYLHHRRVRDFHQDVHVQPVVLLAAVFEARTQPHMLHQRRCLRREINLQNVV